MFGDIIQPTHLLFILVVALVFLGPKRLPEVGRSLGKGIRDFRSAMSGIEEHTTGLLRDEPITATAPAPASGSPGTLSASSALETAPETTATPLKVISSEPEPGDYSD